LADHLHQAGEDADAHPARRRRPARAAAERVRAVSRAAGQQGPDQADRLPGLRRDRPWTVEAEEPSRDDGAQPRVVRSVLLPDAREAVERGEMNVHLNRTAPALASRSRYSATAARSIG